MTPEAREVKAFIVWSLRQSIGAVGVDAQSIPDEFDLRANGVIDSLGFVQLIGELEVKFACPIDLSEVPPDQLTNLRVLSTHIAAQLGPSQRVLGLAHSRSREA